VIEARHVDGKTITLDRRLSKGRKEKRKIWLNDRAAKIVARLCKEHPTGPIFHNTQGKPWKRNQLASRFWRLRTKLKKARIKEGTWEQDKHWIEGLCPYTIRHSYATRMLAGGVDSVKLGVLMGHANPAMIGKIYQHLSQRDDDMLDSASMVLA
jgi:integrase